jgi:Na+-driven multidrug efflux pump
LTKVVRNSLIIGFFANAFLDWMFVAVLNWGTGGLAFATVLVQITQLVYVYYFFAKTELGEGLLAGLKNFHGIFTDSKTIKIIKLAIPSSASVLIVGVGMVALNRYASDLAGSAGISAIGIGFRVEQIFLISLFGGVGPAIMAIASQNYGAGKIDRVKELYRDSIIIGFVMLIIGSFIIYFASELFAKAFTQDADVIRETANYLRIEAFTLPAYVLLFISTSLLSALQKPTMSLIFNVSRQLIAPILIYPFLIAMFASLTGKASSIDNLWYSIMVNNWFHGILVFIITYSLVKNLKPAPVVE